MMTAMMAAMTEDDDGIWELTAYQLARDLAATWNSEQQADDLKLLARGVAILRLARESLAKAALIEGPRSEDVNLAEFHRKIDAALEPGEAIVAGGTDIELATAWTTGLVALMQWLHGFWLDRFMPTGPPGSERLQ